MANGDYKKYLEELKEHPLSKNEINMLLADIAGENFEKEVKLSENFKTFSEWKKDRQLTAEEMNVCIDNILISLIDNKVREKCMEDLDELI